MSSILLTAEEICAVLGIGRATWYRWKNDDNPPPAVLAGRKGRGGAALYDPEEVKAWRRQREADGPLRALVDELPDLLAEAIGETHTNAQSTQYDHWENFFEGTKWRPPTMLKPEGKRLLAATLAATWSRCLDTIAIRAQELGIPEAHRSGLPEEIKRLDKIAKAELEPEEDVRPGYTPSHGARWPKKRRKTKQ